LQLAGVVQVAARFIENGDRLALRLSRCFQLPLDAFQLDLCRKVPSHHRDQFTVAGADIHVASLAFRM